MIFQENYFSFYILEMTKFICLIAFTSGDIEEYLYCNLFVSQLVGDVVNSEISLSFLIKLFPE